MEYTSDQPSFAIDSGYSESYLSENYNPEQHNVLQTILIGITSGFDSFLNQHKQDYGYLRSIDVNKVAVYDMVMATNTCHTGVVMDIKDGSVNVEIDVKDKNLYITEESKAEFTETDDPEKLMAKLDGTIFTISVNGRLEDVHKSMIKPIDEYINKLKIKDISLLYSFIRDTIDKKIYSEIEYFYMFSEYFKINEKTLYNAIPLDIQVLLVDQLHKRVGVLHKKADDSVW